LRAGSQESGGRLDDLEAVGYATRSNQSLSTGLCTEAAAGAGEAGGGEMDGFSSLEEGCGGASLLQALALP